MSFVIHAVLRGVVDVEPLQAYDKRGRPFPATWPTRAAAELYVDTCKRNGTWGSYRDDFAYDFEIREAAEVPA